METGEIRQRVSELIALIRNNFLNPEGLVARDYPPGQRTLFDHFDDWAPFFLYFGEEDFLRSQLALVSERGENLVSCCSEDGVLVTRNVDEWFGGLYAVWKATGDRNAWALLRASVNFALEKLIHGKFLTAAYYVESGRRVPYYECWSAGLLEALCEMRQEFPAAFEAAQRILRAWIQDEYFERYHLFPYRMYLSMSSRLMQRWLVSRIPIPASQRPSKRLPLQPLSLRGILKQLRRQVCGDKPPRGHRTSALAEEICREVYLRCLNGYYSQLTKSNSACAFALLEFYLATGEELYLHALDSWLEAALGGFCEGGKVYLQLYPASNFRKREPGAAQALILVDLICDASFYLPAFRKWLPRAKEILDYYLEDRMDNGLIPYHVGGEYAHLDSQVDFAISLRRYGELNQNAHYLELSANLVQKALQQHYTPDGYLTYSGKVGKNVIDPKYNALLLKGMIHLLTLHQPLYPDLVDLFKDR